MTKTRITATGIVFNDNKETLMIFHKKLKKWVFPGGHVDENELPTDAALREVFEETGIRAKLIPNRLNIDTDDEKIIEMDRPFCMLFMEYVVDENLYTSYDMSFLCQALNTNLKPQIEEIDDIGWFSLEQIKQLNAFADCAATVEKALEFIKEAETT